MKNQTDQSTSTYQRSIRILMLEDSVLDAELITDFILQTGLNSTINRVMAPGTFYEAVQTGCYDVILADYIVPGFDGSVAFEFARQHCPQTPFIFVSGTLGEDIAADAVRNGASDYVTKQRLDRLPRAIHRALNEARLRSEHYRAHQDLAIKETALRISEERLQIALEAAEVVGVWDWNFQSNLIYASPRFAQLYSVDPDIAAIGAPAEQFFLHIHADDIGRLHHDIEQAKAGDGLFCSEYRIHVPAGGIRWVMAKGRVYKDQTGLPDRFAGVSIDVTEQRLAKERQMRLVELMDHLRGSHTMDDILDAAVSTIGLALNVSRVGIARVDAMERFVTIQSDWRSEGTASVAGRHDLARFGQTFIDSLKTGETLVIPDVEISAVTKSGFGAFQAIGIGSLVNLPLIEQDRLAAILFVHDDKARRWTKEDVQFLQDVAERAWSMAERARAEELQKLLVNELNHRVKNTLATVQSITSQTLRNAESIAGARTAIDARLIALSRAHDVLTRENWDGAELCDIVGQAVAPYRNQRENRLHMSGPEVRLSPRTALALAMALQELVTNAVKYGALSNASGEIFITWVIKPDASSTRLHLQWAERGGPPVMRPTRRGFGSRLIERSLAQDLDGEVHIEFDSTGVVCTVDAAITSNTLS